MAVILELLAGMAFLCAGASIVFLNGSAAASGREIRGPVLVEQSAEAAR
jgi:hypothetical protein